MKTRSPGRAALRRQLLDGALANLQQKSIFLTPGGRPKHIPPQCEAWFNSFFSGENRMGGLPETIHRWLRMQRKARCQADGFALPPSPLRLTACDETLEIRWIADEAGNEMVLLAHRSSPLSPANLRKLGLTPRECEVFRWMAEGKTDPEIGLILNMSSHTAHKHVQHVLKKVGVSNRATALLRVFELAGLS